MITARPKKEEDLASDVDGAGERTEGGEDLEGEGACSKRDESGQPEVLGLSGCTSIIQD